MAFQIADRVKETTTTTGTGTFDLGGAVSQFQTFVAGIGNGNETYYSIEDPTGTDWEVGIGTVTSGAPDTLSRDTVISSSNGGSLVNFGAGEKVVFSTQPASKTFILSSDNTAVISNINASTLTAGTVNDARLSANVTLNNASTISTGTLDQDRLANSSITINGTGVALGGSINVGDITGVTAGDGLTGGGTTGAVTLNVGAGTGIDVSADAVAVDVSDFMTNGANNRIVTATGTDAMNAETNLTFDGSTLAVTGGASFTANVALGDLDHILMGATGEYQIYHDHANGVSVIKDADVGGSINIEADSISLTGPVTATANVSLGDNSEIKIGSSDDMYLVHNGSNSYIVNQTGTLFIRGDEVQIESFDRKNYIIGYANSSVDLFYNNFKRFETTAAGATVTGTLIATTFSGSGASLTSIPNGALDNSQITINGTGVSLGGSINVGDITGVTAGDGLTGGGTTGAVTLNVGAGTLIDVAADTVSVDLSELTTSTSDADGDFFCVVDSVNAQKKLTKGNINLSGFNNDAGFSTTTGTVTSVGVTAGSGLTGGGTITSSGTVTLNVGAGTGIDVAADSISVDVSDFMTNGSNNRVLTATGTDGMNAEANMTFDGSTLVVAGGATFTANVSLGDNDYLRFGAGNDFEIGHSSTTGNLLNLTSSPLEMHQAGTNSVLQLINDGVAHNQVLQIFKGATQHGSISTDTGKLIIDGIGSLELSDDGSTKLATTATGISVTGTVVESSSLAYKENVQPLEFNDAIYNVNAVKYDRKDGSSKDEVGVIAEELYEVLPDLVECKDGKPDAVKYTKMTMYLLEALKKQNQEIQLLKEKLNG